LYLSKLEIFGFKTFPEKTVIEFDSGVSAIVGPNGSGKSNIVDAIRWVLGEQGDKILRSARREDVVFNGTSKRKPLSVAEVSLTVQNNKNILPTEYSEVQIARRFFRSGDTEYFLNGTKVRLKDIRNLFMDTGIGPDSYSVIELKMVELMLSAVKNDRRKMFEEAAGIVSYKQNRDLTINRLESVHEHLQRVNDVIKEKQRNVNSLERQARRNEEARIVSENLRNYEIFTSNFDYKLLIDEIKEIKEHEFENISLKERLSSEIKEFDGKYDVIWNEIQNYEETLNLLRHQLSERKDKNTEIEKLNLVTEEKIDNLEKNIERLKEENNKLDISIRNNLEKESDLKNKISILKNTIEISESSLIEKKINVDSTIKIINEKKEEIKSIGIKLKDTNKIVNENKNNYQKNKLKLENNLEKLKKISESTEKNLVLSKSLESDKNIFEKKLKETSEQSKKSETELNNLTDIKNKLIDTIYSSEKRLSDKKLEIQKRKSKINYLKNLLETFEDYAEGIHHLIKEKKRGDLTTLIDSIDVEDKFKIAIETAFGEVSNYLILDDSRELNKLIDSLTNNDKGKVTFILNDKLDVKNQIIFDYWDFKPEFIGEKGVYGFADELVKCKNKEHQTLIKYILDEYIIVEDIGTAFKLSKDNYYKFITLEGDIITESFIRAGGKVKEESIRLGREKQIERLIREFELFEKETTEFEKNLNILREENERIDVESLKTTVDDFTKVINELKKDISIINFKIDEINKILTANEKNYYEIKFENKKFEEETNKLIDSVLKSENEQSNLDKELSFLTDEFNEIEQNYRQYLNEYNSFNLELTKIRNEFKNEEANYQRTINSIDFQKQQIIKNKNQTEKEENLLGELNEKIEENEEKLKDFKKEEESLTGKYNAEKNIYDQKKEIQNKIELEQRSRRQSYDKVSQKLIDSQIKIKENELKSEQLNEFLKKKYEIPITANYDDLKEDENIKNIIEEFTNATGEVDIENARERVDELAERLKKLGGYQQMVWQDFEFEKEELQKMIDQRNDLLESEKDIRKTIDRINAEAQERFMKTFEEIRQNFIKIFKELFQEGDEANLKLVFEEDEDGKVNEDPLEAKIEITAKPRGKRPTSIELLSGGEKTLTAIALLFAIYLVKPSPFCILDEVDAPLDVSNLGRFNKMIRKFSENTQFILITHNERTMERVDKLYGVTMQEPGVTTIVETKFKN
jgi:chromosome segregation protein